MSTVAEAVAALGDKTLSSSALSALLREPPATTLSTLKRARAQGLVIRVDQEWQACDVRGQVRGALIALRTPKADLCTAAYITEALPQLGFEWQEMQALLSLMATDKEIESWFGAGDV